MSWIEKKALTEENQTPWLEYKRDDSELTGYTYEASPVLANALDKLNKIRDNLEDKFKNSNNWFSGTNPEKIRTYVPNDNQANPQSVTVTGGFFKVGFVFDKDPVNNSFTLTPQSMDSNEPETVTADQTVSSTEYTVPRQNSFQRIHLGIKSVPLEHTFGWMKLTPQSLNTLDPTTNASNLPITPTINETSADIVDSDIQYAYQENKVDPVQLESYTFDLDSVSSEPVQSDEPQVIKETFKCTKSESEKPRIFFERTGPAILDLMESKEEGIKSDSDEFSFVYSKENKTTEVPQAEYELQPQNTHQTATSEIIDHDAEIENKYEVEFDIDTQVDSNSTESFEAFEENIDDASPLEAKENVESVFNTVLEEDNSENFSANEIVESSLSTEESELSYGLETIHSPFDEDIQEFVDLTNEETKIEKEPTQSLEEDSSPGSELTEVKELEPPKSPSKVRSLDENRASKSDIDFSESIEKSSSTNQIENLEESKNCDRASITPLLSLAKQYEMPFQMLSTTKKKTQVQNPVEAQGIIQKLEMTLEQFGVEARVIGIQAGPIITRYELKPAPGIKVSKILALTDELAMALEALRVRIEAPIPGRSTVGIEIPNKQRSPVLLGDLIQTEEFKDGTGDLRLPFGKDISGTMIFEDLTRMPHILVAGATGSGKSVLVNSFITSLVMDMGPDEVRFILVDPKLVELSQYNEIPHLLHPVITDHTKAIQALNWAVEEMERRYEDLAEFRVRDIRTYNEKVKTWNEKYPDADAMMSMPYIVVLIDELGDLMMVAGKEVEASIIRLSQKARAVGIHLILATQRPSVDVITALIKANCPARIALQVAQKTDSRTILDSNGAEQLLGQGDMLFKHPSKAQLMRIQAPYVKDEEVEEVVKRAKRSGKPSYITLEDPKGDSSSLESEEEEMFDEAWQIIQESGKASASYLQRRLRIGYNRAARLIEAFEARGYIGPQIGSKPRDILI